jgi:hypothetical protein
VTHDALGQLTAGQFQLDQTKNRPFAHAECKGLDLRSDVRRPSIGCRAGEPFLFRTHAIKRGAFLKKLAPESAVIGQLAPIIGVDHAAAVTGSHLTVGLAHVHGTDAHGRPTGLGHVHDVLADLLDQFLLDLDAAQQKGESIGR